MRAFSFFAALLLIAIPFHVCIIEAKDVIVESIKSPDLQNKPGDVIPHYRNLVNEVEEDLALIAITGSLDKIMKEKNDPWSQRTRINQGKMFKCTDRILCSEEDRALWLAHRNFVKSIISFMAAKKMEPNFKHSINEDGILNYTIYYSMQDDKPVFDYSSKIRELIPKAAAMYHYILCNDTQFTGFLLDDESDKWDIACAWTGADSTGVCVPAPNSSNPIEYKHSKEWIRKLSDFRAAFGCSLDEVKALVDVNELYYCRERCTDGGIGTLHMLVLMASAYAVLALLCTEDQTEARQNN